VTAKGEIKGRYEFHPVAGGTGRHCSLNIDWSEIRKESEVAEKLKEDLPGCGPFEFEIRAWDIGYDDTREIAEHFDIAKGNIRKAIRAYKGISVFYPVRTPPPSCIASPRTVEHTGATMFENPE
jgi:hypothetical protein